ncbi:hypothetical protein AGRHK599_LOCUS3799 [Rhizobium rhizogenes]|uniref:Uncharacterized protein n=1 Tax=Rhizobium rhizogenes TaxID=359 RepID=A0AAN2A6D0_RHIRH|nr:MULTISPECIES: hypothetical protein [Rhizobium/Agrobacterium group]AQS64409.1 hypothetical protein B0909_19205 [Rhizobium rhizogenes]MCZ7441474.1 hypothetical protein [Rhizobium rhizogenes]NSZ81194.1 hypothetical protein [Agrobacterium tumefaciens]OAM62431.1 hypothetical protein A8L48_02890 [Rhizobium rhizogenes]CAD0215551.1 hypothetical protein AGRHK599_LOCUS3799 [Rhizobium rhizogenes]
MPDTPRFFRYAILAAMLPVAVLGIVTTPNEYRAVGIDAVDCDGPISVLIPAVPALAAYAIIGWLFLSGAKRHRSLISGGICVVVSLVLVWSIGLALQEHRLNAAEMACGSSGKL